MLAKKLSGKPTADESSRLAKYDQENEAYQATLDHMHDLQQAGRNDQFLQSAIRVVGGTATPKESGEIRASEKDNLRLWQNIQFMRAMVTGIARAAKVEDDIKPKPMPERVRQSVAAKVEELRKNKQGWQINFGWS